MRARAALPFRVRLALGFALLQLVILTAALATVYHLTTAGLLRNLDRDLLSLAQLEVSSADDHWGGQVYFHSTGSSHFSLLFNGEGRVLTENVRWTAAELERLRSLAFKGLATSSPYWITEGAERMVSAPSGMSRFPGSRILVGTSLLPLRQTLHDLRVSMLLSGLLALLVGGALAWFLARRLTAPLESIAAASENLAAGDFQDSLPQVGGDREVMGLTAALNQMLVQVRQALAEKERQTQLQRQFLADASHELRSPLTGLLGTLEVALRKPREPADYRQALGLALGETQRLARLVDGLLVVSRHQSAGAPPSLQPSALAPLLEQSFRLLQPRARSRGQVLQLKGPVAEHQVLADPDLLRQIIDNLLDNALRHAPEGSQVDVVVQKHESQTLKVGVMDRGPGVADDAWEEIFLRFRRLQEARDRDSGGAGLGLAIARQLAERQGGRLWGEPRPGGGACFWLQLRLA